jgi:type II restriction/modification system DNA methylase subunit YeeA
MNSSKIKSYAIQARRDFIKAVTERANFYGVFGDTHIEPIQIKGDVAIIGDRAFTKKEGELREKLVSRIKRDGFEMTLRASAYAWFNRFVALRYMELHDYLEHGFRVLSNPSGSDTPQILEYVSDIQFQGFNKDKAIELKLAGNKDNELYRLLIIAQCNALHQTMPFLFDEIDSETELLLPDNLLYSDSPVRKLVTGIDEACWKDVEIIGWIYQFYISERKDQVIGRVVKSEDIPAATQLFTPNWIVKYMVQNTLGRMWLATYPDSPLKNKMEYYIEPAKQDPEVQKQIDAITPKLLNPEDITFLDPACGSGHILVEAYDIFKEIYLERGYRTKDIPRLVLEKNLYGLDICDRAAQLAGFAVLMRARQDDRKILKENHLKLNITAIAASTPADSRNIELFFKDAEHESIRRDLHLLVALFESAKTFGSLIAVPDSLVKRMPEIEKAVEQKIGKWHSQSDVQNLEALVKQAGILSRKYDCVVTNPPYMGGKGMNGVIKGFLKDHFNDVKSDLFSAFIVRNTCLTKPKGQLGFMSPFVWMFISSYEKLRNFLIDHKTITSLIQLEYSGFDGATVPICTFTLENAPNPNFKGGYIRLSDFRGAENQSPKTLEAIKNSACGWFFHASAANFNKIPGSPIAYWVSERVVDIFLNADLLGNIASPRAGLATGDNTIYQRLWFEVELNNIAFDCKSIQECQKRDEKWYPCNSGGGFRKWFGNNEVLVNWQYNGLELKNFRNDNGRLRSRPQNTRFYFKPGITWTKLSSSSFAARFRESCFVFDDTGRSAFPANSEYIKPILGLLCSKLSSFILKILNPSMSFTSGDISNLPIFETTFNAKVTSLTNKIIKYSKFDWDSFETSWDFTNLPLLQSAYQKQTLKATYANLRTHWHEITLEIQRLEEENNRIFIDAYGLQDELTPDVPLSEITLTCNPHYRYGGDRTEQELETLLLTDTMKELISYAVGCMIGRYSLDHPGLIYAHSGNKDFEEIYHRRGPEAAEKDTKKNPLRSLRLCGEFKPDDDGIVPVMDLDWFPDDAANRFVEFLKVAWPPETLVENLKFVAEHLKPKTNETPIDTIRRYFSTGFFKDYLKTYKKRPIYWLFSSGRHKAFECLVYLHRYNESTLSRMRSSYVTPLQGKLSARLEYLQHEKNAAATASAQRKIQKEMDGLKKKQAELSAFNDELRHYSDMKISLDLDDGVKVNYGKFGNLLAEVKTITGQG